MMDGTFIEALDERLRRPRLSKVNGIEHLSLPNAEGAFEVVDLPEKTPLPESLLLSTLESLCEYAKSRARDGEIATDLIAHIVDPRTVRLLGKLTGYFQERPELARAVAPDLSSQFSFGKFYSQSPFVIALQVAFVESVERRSLLSLAGNMREGSETKASDDGVSQSVVSSTETRLVGMTEIPNPITLAPYRTFLELDQPESPFIVRAQGGDEDEIPELALFEADGGKWKLDAIASIKQYLTEHLPADVTVLG